MAFLGILALSLGCGGADDNADRESAAQGWRAASRALESASTDFEAEIDGGSGEIEVSCPEGGSVALDGDFSADAFDFVVDFDACGSEGVVVDGSLSYAGEASPGRVEFTYVGALAFSGSVELDCAVDVAGFTETSVEGMNVSASAELRGSICGVSADVVASVDG